MLEMIFGLVGGLAVFIFGMQAIASGLQQVAGKKMRSILEKLTTIPVLGVLLGALVTAIVQSSSLTTVMVVGFVNAGLMTLKQAVSVIMGANIGTTITGQIISFNITKYSLPIIAVGFAVYFFAKNKNTKNVGNVIFSFGFLLLGLTLMSSSMSPLAESEAFHNAIILFQDYRIVGLLIGIGITAIIQSSSASMGILIALATQGLIPLEAALPVLLGFNIGTCVTALLASIGTKLTARRAAFAHVIFNIIGSCIFLLILPWFEDFVLMISPADSIPRQIANAHTIFNISNTIIFLPLINIFTAFIIKIIPGEENIIKKGPVYLDWHMVNQPEFAISLATRELIRMGELSANNVNNSVKALIARDQDMLKEVLDMEENIDDLEKEIVQYLVKVSQTEMNAALSMRHGGLLHAANDIERISDLAENIVELAEESIENNIFYSEFAIKELEEIYTLAVDNVYLAVNALKDMDQDLAQEVLKKETIINSMEVSIRQSHILRLSKGNCIPASGVLYLDIVSNLERIGDHAYNIAGIVMGDI